MPHLSAVGISGLQAGEDVKMKNQPIVSWEEVRFAQLRIGELYCLYKDGVRWHRKIIEDRSSWPKDPDASVFILRTRKNLKPWDYPSPAEANKMVTALQALYRASHLTLISGDRRWQVELTEDLDIDQLSCQADRLEACDDDGNLLVQMVSGPGYWVL